MSQGMHQAQCPAYYSRDLGLWSVGGRLVVGWLLVSVLLMAHIVSWPYAQN